MEQTTIALIFKTNTPHLFPIRQHQSQMNSITTVDSNFTKHMIKYQSAHTSMQINMPANSAGGVWQTSMLIQHSWHQHPQHRICNLICFRTITSYFTNNCHHRINEISITTYNETYIRAAFRSTPGEGTPSLKVVGRLPGTHGLKSLWAPKKGGQNSMCCRRAKK